MAAANIVGKIVGRCGIFCGNGRGWLRHTSLTLAASIVGRCGVSCGNGRWRVVGTCGKLRWENRWTLRRSLRQPSLELCGNGRWRVVGQPLTHVRGQASVRNNDGITMIVRYEHRVVRRTCGSVRSSLSALAWLATAGSEAAETTSFHCPDEETSVRRIPRLPASMRSEGQAE